jgi:hypothetical protein
MNHPSSIIHISYQPTEDPFGWQGIEDRNCFSSDCFSNLYKFWSTGTILGAILQKRTGPESESNRIRYRPCAFIDHPHWQLIIRNLYGWGYPHSKSSRYCSLYIKLVCSLHALISFGPERTTYQPAQIERLQCVVVAMMGENSVAAWCVCVCVCTRIWFLIRNRTDRSSIPNYRPWFGCTSPRLAHAVNLFCWCWLSRSRWW